MFFAAAFRRPRLPTASIRSRAFTRTPAQKSGHAQWYSDVVPAMIPIFLLGSAVYLGLQLTHLKLSHEKFMQHANERVRALEAEIAVLEEKSVQRQPTPSATPVNSRWFRWW